MEFSRLLFQSMGVGQAPVGAFGIGRHPAATTLPFATLREKALGTAPIALGANRSFGGLCDSAQHMALVIASPDIDIDGVALLRGGELV